MADGDPGDFGLASIGTEELEAVTAELVGSMSGVSLKFDVGSAATGSAAASGALAVIGEATVEVAAEIAVGTG
jgi:hypothetical protein